MIALKPPRGLSHTPRRALLLASAALLCLFLLPAVAAQADNSSSLTVIGTSDVSDSGLVPNLIGPEFEQAYPQFSFKYLGNATLTAINDAEAGTFGPSVLVVHAASLENQFVANGFSYQNQYGYAIWRNDFVLAGPAGGSDPAGVGANATNNIVQAFVDVATAGINGGGTPLATFVSRGGAPGTVVAEHAIWQIIYNDSLEPAGLTLCTVEASQGGGMAPVNTGTNGAACPSGGANPTEAQVPDWYVVTGANQGANVVFANNCATSGSAVVNSAANTCYVYTDRGTYDYLSSGTDPNPAASNSYFTIPNLAILTRDNSASAPGGQNELVNYFHAYIINPSAPCSCETVNLTAAQDFIKFITSPAIQSQLQHYLAFNTGDSGGAPFVADASPTVTASGIPSSVNAGTSVTVTGTVTTNEVGYPAIADVPVSVDEVVAGVDVPIAGASGTSNGSGAYTVSFTPPASGSYQVVSGQVSQVEDSSLTPNFGDIQSPGASMATAVTVNSGVAIGSANPTSGGVVVSGTIDPAALDGNARVAILARPAGSSSPFNEIGATAIAQGQAGFADAATLGAGSWQVEATYTDPGEVASSTSAVANVTIPAATPAPGAPPTHTVAFKKVTAKTGKITVTGTLKPGPTSSGAKVELLTLREGKVSKAKSKSKKKKKGVLARPASVGLKETAKTSVGTGKTSFTIRTKLTRGYRWVLELEYVQSGQTSTFSRLSTVAVH
ncbi:MAG TPA: hypothetical protein VIJ20_03455 [Solirubrobacteraceae bacterium]